ncbi:MAG: ABC transporter ATP-binding protein [Microlunatus sp.]|nr:ABC transporter ATP-binding protein [Microlunatus sp.]MDN5769462.1 ABC transporter ATP-binding protein [Microlunatus sp.]
MVHLTSSIATSLRPSPAGAAIELTGLRKSFGLVRAVDGLDLSIAPGEIVAVLGPNGAGKSTTTELITGLVQPDAGSAQVFGLPPRTAIERGLVGVMLQAGALLHEATVRDVLRLMHGLHAHPLPLEEVIERADLRSFWKTRTEKLSGGQAQRLRYALALMSDPQLLILDEPTVGMDVEIRRAFWASMRDFIADGRTVVFATHYLDEADAEADRIVVLARGRVIADGTPAAIKTRVADRTITLADHGASLADLAALPAVISAERAGSRLLLRTTDSDTTLRGLISEHPAAAEIEVVSASLEDAFLTLTHDQPEEL